MAQTPRLLLMCWCALMCCYGVQSASAQGFNWQYSARFPTGYPTLFIGVQGGYSPFAQNSTRLQYAEALASGGTCNCGAEFTGASGQEWRVGLMAEKWLESGDWALYGALTLQHQNEAFNAAGDSTKGVVNPTVNTKGTFKTEYIFSNDLHQIALEGGAKYKFYPLPLFVALGVSGGYIVQTSNSLIEQAKDEKKYQYKRDNLNSNFANLKPFTLAATARIGADVSLAKGLYATPAIFATWQFRSAGADPWTRLALGVHVAFLLGL
jgi:hypothetical protein